MAELQLLIFMSRCRLEEQMQIFFCDRNQSRNQHFLAMDEELEKASAHGLFVLSTKRARKERSAD